MGEPLVGRVRETAALAAALDRAHAGDGGAVVVAGEAGIGKSTLAAGLAARAAGLGIPALAGSAVPDDGVPAFWPWSRLLASPAAARLDLAADLLDTAGADDPASARFRATVRAGDALLAASAAAALLLVVEDLHWADAATLGLALHLAREAAGTRLLLVVTTRDPLPPPVRELAARPGASAVRPGPLEVAAVRELVGALGGDTGSDPVRLQREAGGNPLYLRELIASGTAGDGRGLRSLLLRRLDGVDPEVRALLDAAAVLGEDVDTALLTGHGAALDRACASGLLTEDPRDPRRVRWSHALLRDACYAALDREARIAAHAAAADRLATSACAPPGAVAEHRVRAAVDDASRARAVRACRAAAADALARRVPAEAAAWLERARPSAADEDERADLALEHARALFDNDRVADALDVCREVADLAERLARPDLLAAAAVVVRGIGTEETGEPLRALCDRAGAVLGDEDSARRAAVLAQDATVRGVDDAGTARALAMAERHADEPGGTDALAFALNARHEFVADLDGLTEQLDLGRRMIALGRDRDRPEVEMWGHLWRLDAAFALGANAELDAGTAALAGVAGRLGTLRGRWHLLRVKAARALLAGRYDEAVRLADEYHEVSLWTQDRTAQGVYDAFISQVHFDRGTLARWEPQPLALEVARHLPVFLASVGVIWAERGDVDTARAYLENVRPLLADLPRDAAWTATQVDALALALRFDDVATAADCGRRLRPYAALRADGTPGVRGAVARHVGIGAAAAGEHDDAVRFTADAVVMERRAGAPALLARAHTAHARALLGRGEPADRDRARGAVTEAASLARRLGMVPLAREATALGAEISGAEPGPAALTARERETVALVATGLANREVAERLVVSERTVETHVRNALNKLGLANRTQLAAWAARTRLDA